MEFVILGAVVATWGLSVYINTKALAEVKQEARANADTLARSVKNADERREAATTGLFEKLDGQWSSYTAYGQSMLEGLQRIEAQAKENAQNLHELETQLKHWAQELGLDIEKQEVRIRRELEGAENRVNRLVHATERRDLKRHKEFMDNVQARQELLAADLHQTMQKVGMLIADFRGPRHEEYQPVTKAGTGIEVGLGGIQAGAA